jgi:NADH-quinone oxidoreductase subunit M
MDFLNSWLLIVILFWPAVAAILALMTSNERAIKWGSIFASVLHLGLSNYMIFALDFNATGMQFEVRVPWIEALNASFHLGVDGLSVPLIFLTALLSTLSIYYSAGTIRTRVKEYFIMFHLLALSMFGVFMALDYVLFYVFWEISLVPMYLLIGIWGGQNRNYAAIKFFIYTLIGSVAMLLAILGTYFATGTFNILEAAAAKPFQNLPAADALLLTSLAFWGFFFGFAFKVPSFPFHTWLPDAHTEAPTAGSVILAGVLLKLGAYGLLRIVLPTYPTASQYWAMWLVALGAIAIVYGAFICVAQTDLKRLIAYSSVSHMGYVMLGIGAAAQVITPEGMQEAAKVFNLSEAAMRDSAVMAINGATLQMFNHGIITERCSFSSASSMNGRTPANSPSLAV